MDEPSNRAGQCRNWCRLNGLIPNDDELQEQEWHALYQRIVQTMAQWGVDDAVGKGDYLIVDDNYGWWR